MNKCYFLGKILEISEYKFLYNSKKHNAIIKLKILTLDSDIKKGETIDVAMYDKVADYAYRYCKVEDIIFAEGRIGKNMKIEILKLIIK